MKETFNLRRAVEEVIEQSCRLGLPNPNPNQRGPEVTMLSLTDNLCAEIEANQAILGNELFKAKAAIEFLKNTFSFLEKSNGIFGVDPHMTVDLILSRIADQSQQIKDLENEIAKLKEHLKMTEDTLKWAYYVLGKTLPYLRESNPQAAIHIERALIGLDFTGMEEIASQAKDDSLGEKSGNTPQL